MNIEQLISNSKPFLSYVGEWKKDLPPLPISDVIQNHPENVAVISVDVINGFCSTELKLWLRLPRPKRISGGST